MRATSDRLLGLDVLRGFAAMAVMLGHYTIWFGDNYGHPQPLLFYPQLGEYGVPLFFMISGFVIRMTMDRCDTVRDFAVSRLARLFPVYWAAVVLTYLVVSLAGLPGREVSFATMLINLTMCQQFFNLENVDTVYWTLYIELCFYLVAALVLWSGRRSLLVAALVILIVANLVGFNYTLLFHIPGVWHISPWVPRPPLDLLEFAHFFLFGAALFEARTGWRWWMLPVIALCLVATKWNHTWEHVAIVLAISVIFALLTRVQVPFLVNRLTVYLGTISYSLYLIHANIGFVLIRWGYEQNWNGNVLVILACVLSLALASVLTFAVEQPINRMLRRRYAAWKERGEERTERLSTSPDAESRGRN